MEPDTAGVLVAKVEAGSSADRAGLQRGDVIREVNRKSVADLAAFQKLMADVEQNRELLLLILRDGQPIFLAMAAPGRS
jgi:S1-C subfamily serine protease